MLIRPERGTIEIIEEAVTIRPEERHISRSGNKIFLKDNAFSANFGKAGRVANSSTRAHRCQLSNRINGQIARYGNEGGVGNAGKIGNRREGRTSGNFGTLRIDRPDRA